MTKIIFHVRQRAWRNIILGEPSDRELLLVFSLSAGIARRSIKSTERKLEEKRKRRNRQAERFDLSTTLGYRHGAFSHRRRLAKDCLRFDLRSRDSKGS